MSLSMLTWCSSADASSYARLISCVKEKAGFTSSQKTNMADDCHLFKLDTHPTFDVWLALHRPLEDLRLSPPPVCKSAHWVCSQGPCVCMTHTAITAVRFRFVKLFLRSSSSATHGRETSIPYHLVSLSMNSQHACRWGGCLCPQTSKLPLSLTKYLILLFFYSSYSGLCWLTL